MRNAEVEPLFTRVRPFLSCKKHEQKHHGVIRAFGPPFSYVYEK